MPRTRPSVWTGGTCEHAGGTPRGGPCPSRPSPPARAGRGNSAHNRRRPRRGPRGPRACPLASEAAPSSAGVRQQGHLAGVLHGRRDVALMLHAVPGDASGADLPPLRDVLPQGDDVLVIDVVDPVLAERADLALLLLPGLLVLLALRRAFRFTRHPAVTPPDPSRPRRRVPPRARPSRYSWSSSN